MRECFLSPATASDSYYSTVSLHSTLRSSNSFPFLNYYFFTFIFNGRIIALLCCVGSCHPPMWIGRKYTYALFLLNLPPLHTPSLPSRSSQSTELSSLCYTATCHWLSILHMVMDMFQCLSLNLSHPLLPQCVHKSVLYVCITVPALYIGSSVTFF